MLYELEQAPVEQLIIKQSLRERRPLPDAIANAPELLTGLELYWNGYLRLSRARDVNGRIAFDAILSYARHIELDDDQLDDFIYFLGEMDDTYLEFKRSKEKS